MKLKDMYFALWLWLLIFMCSCSITSNARLHSKQLIAIRSIPNQAEVYVNAEFIGQTPISIELITNSSHLITLKKSGFKTRVAQVNPSLKGQKEQFLEFGMVKDLGYYYELIPAQLELELDWSELPETMGVIPFDKMGDLVTKADRMYSENLLSAEDHSVVINQIISFFNPN